MSHNPPSGPGPQGPQYNQQPGQYPPPGYGQQPPQKKGKKKWVIGCLGLIVLAIVLFAGCAALLTPGATDPVPVQNGTTGTATGEGTENGTSESEDSESAETATNIAIGETVAMGELEHTLHSARFDAGNEFSTPEDGTRWLVIDVELTNNSDESEAISSMMMWTLNDSENRSAEMSIMADTQGSLDGELGAGRSMRGEIAYEVGADETSWELLFSPEVFGFGQAIYDIPASVVQ